MNDATRSATHRFQHRTLGTLDDLPRLPVCRVHRAEARVFPPKDCIVCKALRVMQENARSADHRRRAYRP